MAEREKPGMVRVRVVDGRGEFVRYETVRVDDVRADTPRRGELPAALRERAERLYERCGRRMMGMTVDEWLAGFERDLDPASEIAVWEQIARIADAIGACPVSIKYTQEQVDRAVALVLSGFVDAAGKMGVSDEFVGMVLEMYRAGRGE